MKTLTFIIVLVTELSYAAWLISGYMGEIWRWSALLPAAAVCGISALLVLLYCRVRKMADVKAVMKSGTVLLFGLELSALLLYFILNHGR